MQRHLGERAFTLIEILVVMTLVAILMGIAFPSFIGVMESARKTQAKNDEQQIVTAITAYYTEYGKYPIVTGGADVTFTGTTAGTSSGSSNAAMFDVLRNNTTGVNGPSGTNIVGTLNPRQIIFVQPPVVKNFTNPVLGIVPNGYLLSGIWYDPWGSPYNITLDGNYSNSVLNPYISDPSPPGGTPLSNGVITWSFGKNGILGGGANTGPTAPNAAEGGSNGTFTGSSDVISWQ
jgi:prepilin-type N-terminal cleavage/methylation domain-containing protein